MVLAITSTWDEEAEATAKFLIRINERYAERGAVVLAACIELESNPTERLASIHAFRKQHGLTSRILPIDLSFTRTRIHRFAGLPLLLVFDAEGTLVLRETGSSPAIHASVEAAIDHQLEGREPEYKKRAAPKGRSTWEVFGEGWTAAPTPSRDQDSVNRRIKVSRSREERSFFPIGGRDLNFWYSSILESST